MATSYHLMTKLISLSCSSVFSSIHSSIAWLNKSDAISKSFSSTT
ncbi:hypothetical protein SAV0861 [Staphylococcus aureus subsp. aureus Mu50]|uniref:Uncharacterized protein n=1 Tax=Staphylococcus aureus (strain Mu50 / ATCC 700699) TaxID=158878 RepID=A0A0H3JQM3_STAAM|nr:hypothetical protein SAV0861 [Staphylococcus aureus subsp. aureus Mu50]BAF77739.1 hypothetical protein SAHV_0856 [Staphylococcus aureus subsp. aureus Mu3]